MSGKGQRGGIGANLSERRAYPLGFGIQMIVSRPSDLILSQDTPIVRFLVGYESK